MRKILSALVIVLLLIPLNAFAADKSEVESALASLKAALSGSDTELIKTGTENLTQVFYKVSEKLYSQAAQAQPEADMGGGAQDTNGGQDYYDADYTVVDDQ